MTIKGFIEELTAQVSRLTYLTKYDAIAVRTYGANYVTRLEAIPIRMLKVSGGLVNTNKERAVCHYGKSLFNKNIKLNKNVLSGAGLSTNDTGQASGASTF